MQTAEEVDRMFRMVRGHHLTFEQLYTIFQDQKPNIFESYKVMARQENLEREKRDISSPSFAAMSVSEFEYERVRLDVYTAELS
jgi:hypothetical protein